MPRTAVVVTTLEGAFGNYGVNEADITMAAADIGNQNYHVLQEGDIIFVHNTDVAEKTITINSVADLETGRTGDITAYALAADDYAAFGPFTFRGWRQPTTGWLHWEGNDADIKIGVLRIA